MSHDSSKILTDVVEKLSMTTSLPHVTSVVAEAARKLTGADGATFVLRDHDKCFYADEDAISPLWKGHRFPIESCISGWSMIHRQPVVIKDIYQDNRIPHDAYRPTFVKSLCMVPIRVKDPLGAIGNYWANGYEPDPEEIKLLQVLANSAAIALENLQLKQSVLDQNLAQGQFNDLEKHFETALHTMAHDLRNPLSTMLLFTEMLQSNLKDKLDPRFLGYLNSILKTGRHANEQIQRMLSLYSVSSHRMEKEDVNLSIVAEEICEDLSAKYKDRAVEYDIQPNLRAPADPLLIRLALENLVSNAFKYTGKKDAAVIQFKQSAETKNAKTYVVEDNGDGFDASQSELLFRPLVRLHNESEFPGTGLGLASVAKIIQMHGGAIHAEGAKQQGAKFFFTLPL